MCTLVGYCREHGVAHEVWDDGPMTCERAQQIRARLTAQSPTAAESAEFWADEPAAYDLERFVWHPESANGSKMSTDTPAASSAGRSPHSKPKVMPIYGGGGWFVMHYCCPPAPGEEPPDDCCAWEYFDEQPEAMDDAFAHVREVHTPKPPADIAELVGLADYSKPWPADDPMDRTYNEGARRD